MAVSSSDTTIQESQCRGLQPMYRPPPVPSRNHTARNHSASKQPFGQTIPTVVDDSTSLNRCQATRSAVAPKAVPKRIVPNQPPATMVRSYASITAPGHELLGEMFLQLDEPAQALEQFEATLRKEPERFRALYGAAHSARLSENREATQKYFRELLKVCVSRKIRDQRSPARCFAELACPVMAPS
jgi:hypothetical protein